MSGIQPMQCNIKNIDNKIEKYLSESLSQDEMESFEKHYFECPECFCKLLIHEEVALLVKQKGTVLFADYLIKQKKNGFFFLSVFN